MKHLLKGCLCSVAIACSIAAEGQIGPEQLISRPVFPHPELIHVADLDGDQVDDLISTDYLGNIVWWHNTGAEWFSAFDTISVDTLLKCSSIFSADMDGDLDNDVLVTYNHSYHCWGINDNPDGHPLADASRASIPPLPPPVHEGYLAWFENLGNGEFAQVVVLEDSVTKASSVHAADLDGDQDVDIVLGTMSNHCIDSVGYVAWYENLGNGAFGQKQLISPLTDSLEVFVVRAVDVDDDDDMDVVATYNKNRNAVWYLNDGSGNFGIQQVIDSSLVYNAHAMAVGDIDGDEDDDLLFGKYDQVLWVQNLNGNFNVDSTLVNDDVTDVMWVNLGDLDADGDLEAMSASRYDDTFSVFENLGQGSYGPQIVVDSSANAAAAITSIDADGNDQLELMTLAWYDDDISWYPNLGALNFGQERRITPEVYYPSSVVGVDLDDDDDNDIIVASNNNQEIVVYRNLGGSFSNAEVVLDSIYAISGLDLIDFDNDAILDIVFWHNGADRIYTVQGTGNGTFGQPVLITDSLNSMINVANGQLDGDGFTDLASASYYDDKVVWYQNLGGGSFGPEQVLTDSLDGARSVTIADLNGDQLNDIVASSINFPEELVWFENLGNGSFSEQEIIEDSIDNIYQMEVLDVDFDLDQDIIAQSEYGLIWCENLGGGIFQTPIVLDSTYMTAFHFQDLNGNGHYDFLSPDQFFLDNGGVGVDTVFSFSDNLGNHRVEVADLDGDLDEDVITTASNHRVSWYENLYLLTDQEENASEISDITIYPNPTTGRSVIRNTEKTQLTIMDVEGRVVVTKTCNVLAQIDLSEQPDGLYLLRFEGESGITNKKLVKMN